MLAHTLELRGLMLAAAEFGPELPVFGALPVGRLHEHAVVLALDFRQRVAQRIQKALVCRQNGAVEAELNDCLHLVYGCKLGDNFVRALGGDC